MERAWNTNSKVVIVSKISAGTGNNTTTLRLAAHFGSNTDVYSCFGDAALPSDADLYVALNAYRCANRILKLPLKCKILLVFGGTDVNENINDPEKMELMKRL